MKKQLSTTHATILAVGIATLFMLGQMNASAQQPAASDPNSEIIDPGVDTQTSEYVTINVKNANISEVLKAYSLQTGQSIVVGPDVVSDNVNVRLNNIPWQEALDVILKPYGFGYRVVGDTIVISKLENIVTVEGIEPLASKVFTLKYLDAYDVKPVCEAQLSSRGKFTILASRGLAGWEFGGAGTTGGAATEGGIRQRKVATEDINLKSKTFVVTDVPASLTALEDIIEEMDVQPAQILIEARFLEVKAGGLSDIGMDFLGGIENVVEQNLSTGSSGNTLQPSTISELNKVLNLTTGFVDPLQTAAAGSLSQDTGLRLSHAEIGDTGMELIFALMAKDDDVNILSAPRILTLNNQEAAILVGQKYPIIESQSNTGGGGTTTSTSLDYYENIGIQLNVVPQLCAEGYISMVVHPAVSEIAGFESGLVFSGSESAAGTQYPVLDIREAETQIMIKSGNTAVIGGLQSERDQEYIQKIPLLGDIPFLGRLFRRETMTKEKNDLLIFLKASVVESETYAAQSLERQQNREAGMRLDLLKSNEADAVEVPEAEEAVSVPVAEGQDTAVEAEEGADVENEEILALVRNINADTNVVEEVE